MAFRGCIPVFQLANPLYIGASVSFFTVDANGHATATLATLFADPTSNITVINPQTLDSEGKFSAPVYIETPVIAQVQGPNVTSHSTGVINPRGTWRGNWAASTVYFSEDFIQDPATLAIYAATNDYTSSSSLATDIANGNLKLVFDPAAAAQGSGTLAVKIPCRCATTANITLSALQTIDGVALNAGDRVLVKNQVIATQNGIYNAAVGAWVRANDFAASNQLLDGCQVYVNFGALNGGRLWQLTTADPITLGTSNITFASSVACLTNTNTWTATQTFQPPSGTTTQAIVAIQTLPSGNPGQPATFNFNKISGTNPGYPVTGTNTNDAFGLLPMASVLRVEYTTAVQGAGNQNALCAASALSGQGDVYGAALTAYCPISAPTNTIWGGIAYTNVGPSGSIQASICLDAESEIATGGAAQFRIGVLATSKTGVQGSIIDAAFAVRTDTGSWNVPPYDQGKPWISALALMDDAYTSTAPLTATGNVILCEGTWTTGNFLNAPNVTWATNFINTKPVVITGAGSATFNGGGVLATIASGGSVSLVAQVNGAHGGDGIQIQDSSGNNELAVFVFEAGNTDTLFGLTKGNYAGIWTLGSTNIGLLLGTGTNEPLIVGTNNTAWLNLSGAGLFAYTGPQQYTIAQTIVSATAAHWRNIYMAPATTTITGNTGSPITRMDAFSLGQQTLTDSAAVTVTDAATLYVDNAPAAAGSVTITNAWAILVGTGNVKFPGVLAIGGSSTLPSGPQLVISKNTGALNVAGQTAADINTLYANADGNSTRNLLLTAGAGKFSGIVYAHSEGTIAAPTATLSGDPIFSNFGFGYGTSYQTGGGAGFLATATENFDGTHGGTKLDFKATANGSVTQLTVLTVQAGVQVGAPAGGDPGAGSLSAQNDLYTNNTNFLIRTKTTLANAAAAQTATLTNAPAAGNPTKWIAFDDNGTTRHIPAW